MKICDSINIKAKEEGFEGLIVPVQNAREAAVVDKLKIFGVENIREVIDFFNSAIPLKQTVIDTREEFGAFKNRFEVDFSEVKGQENVKRALEIAAAGGHNLLMIYRVYLLFQILITSFRIICYL